jgi:ADP-heptose:LPS heptosyltransferase
MTEANEAARKRLLEGGRILVTRLRYIGDVVLSLPLVGALRRAFPNAEIHYLADPAPLQVLEEHPDVDRLWSLERGTLPMARMMRALRQQRFAAVIDLFSNPRSALLVRATGATVRIGEARRGRRHLYTVQRRLPLGRSALLQHLDAATSLGVENPRVMAPRIHLNAGERARGAVWNEGTAPHVLLHSAATQPAKEWPHHMALDLVKRLLDTGHRILLSTAPHRPQTSAELAAAEPRARLLDAMPLRELLAVMASMDAVVGVDGAIIHSSVALGRPTLALFGPTEPQIWFPYTALGPFRVLHAGVDCGRCDRNWCPERRCMSAIQVDEVERNVRELLQSTHSVSGSGAP